MDIVSGRTYIISDEIYRNTGFDGRVPSILDVASKEDMDHVIITNSFSKGFRMYTSRVGFSILPDHLHEPFRVLLQHTLLTTNPAEQFACVEALNHLDEVEKLTAIYKEHNNYTVAKLSNIEGVTVHSAQGGFYLVLSCAEFMKKHSLPTSFDLAKDILLNTGVAVVPGSDFGLPDGLRISFTHLRYNEAIDKIHTYFTSKNK